MNSIVLFDGICNFCNSSVQFIIKRDSKGHYQFTSLQSKTGVSLLEKYGITKNIESIVLIEGDQFYTRSTAALRICRNLEGPYRLLAVLLVVPAPIRDVFYNFIAKNRYRWFGKQESCTIPSPEVRSRFLD
ncbi:thiol-disulfide oxidoreductase DCC family protein [Fredinandcohnia sp. 179-A 10B2 NHS]|uniref:thiol-disulfide oxidoreductase DCC family protein n=1 Tax=Fredinandcohnia sp. 179-A 10B2 NHS TaxID=3235176 RepID=UPI0039A2C550